MKSGTLEVMGARFSKGEQVSMRNYPDKTMKLGVQAVEAKAQVEINSNEELSEETSHQLFIANESWNKAKDAVL